jgi:hypothetical protein
MKLKSALLFLVLASSCSNTASPFRISTFFPLGAGCDTSGGGETAVTTWGMLDVAAGAPQFFVGVRLEGAQDVQQTPVMVGTVILENADRNRPIVDQQVISYRLSKRVGATPKPYVLNRTASFNEDGIIIMPLQLISPDLGIALTDGLTPSNSFEDVVDIQADVEFKGKYSATGHPFSTGVLTYPIRAYKSAPTATCTNGFVKFEADPCQYVGQGYGQVQTPASPSTCCTTTGPAGGPGC